MEHAHNEGWGVQKKRPERHTKGDRAAKATTEVRELERTTGAHPPTNNENQARRF